MDSKRQGIQIWTVPKTGYYKFDVSGAGGNDTLGDYTSGASSKLTGYVKLKMNEKIHIACGQNSQRWGDQWAGGHGGTFVVKEDGTPLIISGGGSGGINHQSGGTPRKKTNGISTLTSFNSKGVAFSTDQNGDNHLDTGYGGKVLKHEPGGTGAGFRGDGEEDESGMLQYGINAKGWDNGLTGGRKGANWSSRTNGTLWKLAEGGFGGGAHTTYNTHIRPGGGGGYSGGQGAVYNNDKPAGAGGSYYNPDLVKDFNVGYRHSGPGKVVVTFVPEYTEETIGTIEYPKELYPFKSFPSAQKQEVQMALHLKL